MLYMICFVVLMKGFVKMIFEANGYCSINLRGLYLDLLKIGYSVDEASSICCCILDVSERYEKVTEHSLDKEIYKECF